LKTQRAELSVAAQEDKARNRKYGESKRRENEDNEGSILEEGGGK